MYLMQRPSSFDVILAPNCFGDILSDEASILAGSLGMLPSASIGTGSFGVYEPIHGSAPDIEGQGIANPIATILSAAMLLRHSLGRDDAATGIEKAMESTLHRGLRTADIASPLTTPSTTGEFTRAVVLNVESVRTTQGGTACKPKYDPLFSPLEAEREAD